MAKKIALTGGPCSGKTTGLAYVAERLWDAGYRPIVIPEIATLLISNGIPDINNIAVQNPALYCEIERAMYNLMSDYQKRMELFAAQCEAHGEKVVMLCDRGKMDVRAYVDEKDFADILQSAEENEHCARESYDAVIHLVTAAKGAEAHYTTANNKARRETLEEARIADHRTLVAWQDHSHLVVIDNVNSKDFEHKMRRFLQAVLNILGVPQPVEIERKFLLSAPPSNDIPELRGTRTSAIEQMYLPDVSDERIRIRKRTFDDFSLYYETRKRHVKSGTNIEIERLISAEEYNTFSRLRKSNTCIIRKERRCFVYHDRRFELDTFIEPSGLCVLEVELADFSEQVKLPPFVDVIREVTCDPEFSNYNLAHLK